MFKHICPQSATHLSFTTAVYDFSFPFKTEDKNNLAAERNVASLKVEKQFNFSALSLSSFKVKVYCHFCTKTHFSQISEWPGSPAVNLTIPHESVRVRMISVRLYGLHAVRWRTSFLFFSSIFIHFLFSFTAGQTQIYLYIIYIVCCRTSAVSWFVHSKVLKAEFFCKGPAH